MHRSSTKVLATLLFGSAALTAQGQTGLGGIGVAGFQAAGTYSAPVATAPAVDAAPAGSNADSPFFRDALAGGEREVTLSQLAMSQSTSAQVKSLAGTMVSEHTAMNRELMAMGKVSETPLAAADKRVAADMQKMTGPLFDRTYLATMASDHERAIALFEDASLHAQSSTTRDFARTALEQLRRHLLSVQDLQKQMQGT